MTANKLDKAMIGDNQNLCFAILNEWYENGNEAMIEEQILDGDDRVMQQV